MRPLAQLAEILVSDDPHTAADRALRYLIGNLHCAGGAVLAVLGAGELRGFVVRDAPVSPIAEVRRQWAAYGPSLHAGKSVSVEASTVVPLDDGGRLVGLLVLGGEVDPENEYVRIFGLALAKTIVKAQASHTRVLMEAACGFSTSPTHPEALTRLLSAQEWNIARVARLLGVTRRTIYLRLQRYGIERQKVRKTMKKEEV